MSHALENSISRTPDASFVRLHGKGRRKRFASAVLAIFACLSIECLQATTEIGLPFSRSYSLEDVGVSRGVQLGFDPIGRLAAIDRNRYVVLNDSTWINQLEDSQVSRSYTNSINDEKGNIYFGALSSWGILERRPDGFLQRVPIQVDEETPSWINSTSFSLLLNYGDGIFFGGINGLVYWDRTSDRQTFIEAPDLLQLFTIGTKAYLSSYSLGVCEIDLSSASYHPLDLSLPPGVAIFRAAEIDGEKSVVSTTENELLVFDGQKLMPWPNELGARQSTQISNLLHLPDGDLAISIDGRGLFILSPVGVCKQAFTTPEYHRVNHLASREAGVLWAVTESEIQKILYSDPVTLVDQRSGVTISWPQLVENKDTPLIISHGILYEIDSENEGLSPRYRQIPNLPESGVLAATYLADQVLVGNRDGVYRKINDSFERILPNIEVNRLLNIGPRQCLAIGRVKIAALEWDGNSWIEAAPSIPGVGFPYICIASEYAAWIELGNDRTARITLEQDRIKAEVFENYPWETPSWVHVGVVGDIVVLVGDGDAHLFYDDKRSTFTEDPELEQLIAQAPSPIFRPIQDANGTVWAAHNNGIYAIEKRNGRYHFDSESYRTIRAHVPILQRTGDQDIWVTNGSTLFHVSQRRAAPRAAPQRPTLVSITETISNRILYSAFEDKPIPESFPFSLNDLEFQFFGGSYASASSPFYEFELTSDSTNWTVRSTDSVLELRNLSEDAYRLSAQLSDYARQPIGDAYLTRFAIAPPWFRTRTAYSVYWATSFSTLLAIGISLATRNKRRHAYLEALVNERTEELRNTLEKLNEKERKAAILAERNRLASEIHDSLQQGLSGLALQIEATLKLPELVRSVRSRLDVAKNMVSFTRHEVQQAVWGLESPLLENSDLASALQKMVELIGTGTPRIEFHSEGTQRKLGASTQHHLLRIAQESVTNAIKHANCQQILVELTFDDDSVTLQVSDDGDGFQPEQVLTQGFGHFGMRGMKGRAAKIKGKLEIHSQPGHGSRVCITSPLSES